MSDALAITPVTPETSPMLGGSPGKTPSDSKVTTRAKSVLDSEENRKLLRQFEEWYEVERIRQAPNRYQQAIDDDFYDSLQWSDDDAQELALRGQAPLVYNKIQPAIKWVTGTEKRTRIDWKILPRKDGGVNEAENKTKLMKYLQDVNKSAYARSRAFEQAVRTGVGWLECGIRGDPTKELIYDRNESWRNIIYDSQSVEYDLSDARYQFRSRWTDEDIACLLFPKRAGQIKSASVYSDFADAQDNEEWYLGQILQERAADGSVLNRRTYIDTSSSLFNRRARIKLMEVWYRCPTSVSYIHGPQSAHHNTEYNPEHPEHIAGMKDGTISLYDRLALKMWCAVYIRGTLLQNMRSPYAHDDFPFTPIWANRRGRDHAPYGMARVMRDPQEDFNKRMSKALHSFSSRRVVMDPSATMDVDEVREEAARPDSVFFVKTGARFELLTDLEIGEHHIKYANLDEKAIQDNSGVTDEMMGHKSNAISGRAIEARTDQGSTVTTDFFDNLRLGTQLHGQKILSLIKQYYTEEKEIRVLGSKQPQDFITLNKVMPDGSIENDVTQTEADFIVSETDYRASQRQAMYESLMSMCTEIMKAGPEGMQMAMGMLDDVIEFSDIPGKDQLVSTIRAITGKPDPEKRLTPEEKQAAQQKAQQQAQEQAMVKELQIKTAMANLAVLQGKAKDLEAKAAKAMAEAQAVGTDDGSGQLAESYNQRLQALHDEAESTIQELRKQLMEADQRALDHQMNAQAKVTSEKIKGSVAVETTQMKIDSAERIASMNDRTQEAIGKNDRVIAGLKEQEQALSQMVAKLDQAKLDKPKPKGPADPFEQLHQRVDKTDANVAAVSDKSSEAVKKVADTTKDQVAKAAEPDPRVDKLVESVKELTALVREMHTGHKQLEKKVNKPAPEPKVSAVTVNVGGVPPKSSAKSGKK